MLLPLIILIAAGLADELHAFALECSLLWIEAHGTEEALVLHEGKHLLGLESLELDTGLLAVGFDTTDTLVGAQGFDHVGCVGFCELDDHSLFGFDGCGVVFGFGVRGVQG